MHEAKKTKQMKKILRLAFKVPGDNKNQSARIIAEVAIKCRGHRCIGAAATQPSLETCRSQLAHWQTAALPPAPPLPLHLELRVHELGLHPGAFLLVVSHAGSIEEFGEMGDCLRCDDGWERHFVAVVC